MNYRDYQTGQTIDEFNWRLHRIEHVLGIPFHGPEWMEDSPLNEDSPTETDWDDDHQQTATGIVPERLARLEIAVRGVVDTLKSIEDQLEQTRDLITIFSRVLDEDSND